MRPLVIFRHACCDNVGHLGAFLKQKKIPWQEVRLDLNQPVPSNIDAYSGVIMMGGPMSVNDDLPWIAPLIAFVQSAFDSDIPVMGHCLGGQLMSKALGASVAANDVQEIGWGELQVHDNPVAKHWFGDKPGFLGFHWHSETFSLPKGVTHLLSSEYCENQAYAFGKNLAMQCHIEMDLTLVNTWCEAWHHQIAVKQSQKSMQTIYQIYDNVQTKLKALNQQANQTYSQWIEGLAV